MAQGRPVRMVDAPDVWGHPARIFGFPEGRPAGVWHAGVLRSRQADGWIQTDLASDGYRVSGGFSGSPVWDEDLSAVVGMVVVAESGEPGASYLIPTDALLRDWEPLRALTLPPSPFRGLAPFQETDAATFHGREEESEELTAKVAAEHQVCLVGPSGSGKSSLALAGVVPRLRARGFSVGILRPAAGSRPLSALAAALLPLLEPELSVVERLERTPALVRVLEQQGVADTVTAIRERQGTRGLLLVVDQFEELLVSDPGLVDELAGALYTAPLPPDLHVLTTLRADFLEKALTHAQVGAAFRNRLYALGAPSPQQLRHIVTAPVTGVPGVGYEAGLVERVLADAGEEPGTLPLLGFTLDRLWRNPARRSAPSSPVTAKIRASSLDSSATGISCWRPETWCASMTSARAGRRTPTPSVCPTVTFPRGIPTSMPRPTAGPSCSVTTRSPPSTAPSGSMPPCGVDSCAT